MSTPTALSSQHSSPSAAKASREQSRSSPRKPSLSTRMSGVLAARATSSTRLEPLATQDGICAAVSPLLARSLSRPKSDPSSSFTPPQQAQLSAPLPRMLKLTRSPSPLPCVPLGQSAAVERQEALDRKAAFLTEQIKTHQLTHPQRSTRRMGHALTVLPDTASATGSSTPFADLSLTTRSELASSSPNVLTLDPTLHRPSTSRTHTSQSDHTAGSPFINGVTRPDDDDDTDAPYRGNVLTDELLKDWTGWEDLPLVLSAEFRIDATQMLGLDQLGSKLPQLSSLKLSKSRIPQMRLLGSKFHQLKYLWVNNCRLEGLRGIGSCAPHLEELYAAFNRLSDLSPLLDISGTLRVLDVEGNDVADSNMLSFVLRSLRQVTSLTLQMNPVESDPAVQDQLKAMEASENGAEAANTPPSRSSAKGLSSPSRIGAGEAVIGEDEKAQDDSTQMSESDDDDEEEDGQDFTAGEKQLLALRRWVALMMPQLEYFDDIAMCTTDEEQESANGEQDADAQVQVNLSSSRKMPPRSAGGEHDDEAPSPDCQPPIATRASASPLLVSRPSLRPTSKSKGATPQAKLRAAYVDPMDFALAEELRLVRECIRDTDFDTLDKTLEEMNSNVYSRPATSCDGAVPRSRPVSRVCGTSGGRLGQPMVAAHTTLRLGEKAGGGGAAALGASSSGLTTGDVFAGSAIANLRRRLSPTVTPPQPSSGRLSASAHSSSCSGSPVLPSQARDRIGSLSGGIKPPSVRLGPHATDGTAARTPPDEAVPQDADESQFGNMALFDDDEEEDWERFKASLLAHESYSQRPSSRQPCEQKLNLGSESVPRLASRAGSARASPLPRDVDDTDHQQRYQQLKLRMAAAATSSETEMTVPAVRVVTETCGDAHKEMDNDASRSSTALSFNDEGLSTGLSRPSSGTTTLRIGSASLSHQHMLSGLSFLTTAPSSRPPRTSLRVVPMSSASRRINAPRSAGSQDRPASGTKSVGPDDSDDGFEGTLKSELLHARAQLARSHAPYAGEDMLPDE